MSKLGRGLAMALMSVGNSLSERSKENRQFEMAKKLAEAKRVQAGPESTLGKLGFDYYGRLPQSPAEWREMAALSDAMSKSSGAGGVNVTIPGMDQLLENVVGEMNQYFAPQKQPQQLPVEQQPMSFDYNNPKTLRGGKVKLYPRVR